MQTLLRILERAGGYRPTLYLKIENPPYMALVIEATPEPGPLGLPSISIAHYGEQNGDLMRDPEMCFELSKPQLGGLALSSWYYRNDYLGIEQYSRYRSAENYVVVSALYVEHEQFARQWDRNLRAQGFLEPLQTRPFAASPLPCGADLTPDVSPLRVPSPFKRSKGA